MKLNELLKVIDYSNFDFGDSEWDTCFYAEPTNEFATSKIDVVKVNKDYIICDFTKFIKQNKKYIINKLYDYYDEQWASYYRGIIEDPRKNEDEYCCEIIENFMGYILEEENNNNDLYK